MDYSINSRTQTQVAVNSFVQSVYGWMAFGLGITGLVAMFIANSPTLLQLIFGNQLVFFGLIIAELVLVFYISARVHRMAAGTATGLFLLYAALNGATLSFIFIAYTRASIASTFFICAGTFAACSVYGWAVQKQPFSANFFCREIGPA